jgi:uncharacterized protein YdaU (DUF1376 family)
MRQPGHEHCDYTFHTIHNSTNEVGIILLLLFSRLEIRKTEIANLNLHLKNSTDFQLSGDLD